MLAMSRVAATAEEMPGIADNAYDFDILIVRHEAEANGLSNCIAIRENVFRESAVHDGETRVLFIIGLLKVAAAKHRNSERLEKARRNRRCIGHEAVARVQIGRHSRNRVMPDFRSGDRRSRKTDRTNSGEAGNTVEELLVVGFYV